MARGRASRPSTGQVSLLPPWNSSISRVSSPTPPLDKEAPPALEAALPGLLVSPHEFYTPLPLLLSTDSRAGEEGSIRAVDHAVIGGVVAVVVFAMLCLLIILGRYFARHKGKQVPGRQEPPAPQPGSGV